MPRIVRIGDALMPRSSDPAKAAVQLANLKQNRPDASKTHGAYAEDRIRPHRERHLAELTEAFPSATEAELAIQAQRLAQLELLGAFLDERGVIQLRRRGNVFPAASMAERLAAAFEKQHAMLLQREQVSSQPASKIAQWQRQLPGGAS